jgi:hypothetical protein
MGKRIFFRDEDAKRKRRKQQTVNSYIFKSPPEERCRKKKSMTRLIEQKATSEIYNPLFKVSCSQIIILFLRSRFMTEEAQ